RREYHAPYRAPPPRTQPPGGILQRRIHLSQAPFHRGSNQRNSPYEIGQRQDPERAYQKQAPLHRRHPVEGSGQADGYRGRRYRPRECHQQLQQASATEAPHHHQVCRQEADDHVCCRRYERHHHAVSYGTRELRVREEPPEVLQRVLRRERLRGPGTIPRERHQYHHQVRQDKDQDHQRGQQRSHAPPPAAYGPPHSGALAREYVVAPALQPAEQQEGGHRAERQHGGLHVRDPHVPHQARGHDLRGEYTDTAAEHVRRGE